MKEFCQWQTLWGLNITKFWLDWSPIIHKTSFYFVQSFCKDWTFLFTFESFPIVWIVWEKGIHTSVQFSSVTQTCPTLCDPMGCSTPGLPVHHQLPESTLTHVHWVSDAIQPSHPLSSSSPPALNLSQHQGRCNESALRIRWPKYWSVSFTISSSNEYLWIISFRKDWFDLLALQGTLKSLLQNHSSKASILQCSAFFIVQLSHPCMTIGKTIALTRQTFAGKVMSLLFKVLSRLVIAFLPRSKSLLISWLQSPSSVILEPRKIKSATVSLISPSICHEVMGLNAVISVCWILSLKPTFSLSSFTFIKRLFSFSLLSAIRVVSSAHLRLLIFLSAILIKACYWQIKETWIVFPFKPVTQHKKSRITIYCNMDRPRDCHIEWSKSDRERQISCGI